MYTQFYNFSEKPFNLTPDPKFLYLTPSHREALASMLYGINERKGFIVITGEVGVGKTTLIYTLLNNLNEKVKTAFAYHTSATFDQLLSYILLDLNVTVDSSHDKITLLGKLNEYLTHNISQDETLAIIIDEAQNLPNKVLEEFRLLSNLETSKQKLLQILLVGQPELADKLNSQDLRQLKQRIDISRTIKPLNAQERAEYIDHRLKIAGSNSKNVFSSDAIASISKYSEGIPRVINIICDNALLIGYSHSQKKISGKIVKEVIEDLNYSIGEVPVSQSMTFSVTRKEKAFSRKALGLFICSVVLLVALALFALTNREESNESSLQENVVKLTQIPPKQNIRSKLPQTTITNQPVPIDTKQQLLIKEKPAAKKPLSQGNLKKITLHKGGGSLYTIALNTYKKANPTIYDLILRANPDITDIRQIPNNQEILLPDITRESFILETDDGSYWIYAGTFNTPTVAKVCTEKLAPLGKKSRVQDHIFSPRDTWYRVTLGIFGSKNKALEAIDYLQQQGIIFIP